MVQYLQFGFCMQIYSAVGTLDPPSRNRVKPPKADIPLDGHLP